MKDREEHHLDLIAEAAKRLNISAGVIGDELRSQNEALAQLDAEIDLSTAKLDGVMRRMAVVFKTNNLKELKLIAALSLSTIVLTILVVVL